MGNEFGTGEGLAQSTPAAGRWLAQGGKGQISVFDACLGVPPFPLGLNQTCVAGPTPRVTNLQPWAFGFVIFLSPWQPQVTLGPAGHPGSEPGAILDHAVD